MIVKTVDNKVVGSLDNGIFTKQVQGSKHMLLTPPAWAVDAYIYDHVLKGHCYKITIVDRENNKKYSALFKTFEEHKGIITRDFGKQYFLTLNWWETN